MVAFYSLTYSSLIMKMILRFQRLQQYVRFPNRTIGSKYIARSSFNGMYVFI